MESQKISSISTFFFDDSDIQKKLRNAILEVNNNEDCNTCILYGSQIALVFLDNYDVDPHLHDWEIYAFEYFYLHTKLVDIHVQCLTRHAFHRAKIVCLDCWDLVFAAFHNFVTKFKQGPFRPPFGFLKKVMLAYMINVKHWDNCDKGCLPPNVNTFLSKFWRPKIAIQNVTV